LLPALLGSALLGAALLASPVRPARRFVARPLSHWCRCRGPECYGGQWYPLDVGMSWIFMSPGEKKLWYESRWSEAESWEPGSTSWKWELTLKADSWPAYDLFPELEPLKIRDHLVNRYLSGRVDGSERYVARSPSGKWSYINRVLPKGEVLDIHILPEDAADEELECSPDWDRWSDDLVTGNVMFDGPVVIPVVFEGRSIWMSHTPFEVMSQLPITRYAKGKVVVVGLGLGWLLQVVANNPSVTEVVLVERSQELVDWILPRLCRYMPADKPVSVIVGDAYEVLPTLQADWALVDIWQEYTEIEEDMERLYESAHGIERWWGWGQDWSTTQWLRQRR
jgi:hypothetical protein